MEGRREGQRERREEGERQEGREGKSKRKGSTIKGRMIGSDVIHQGKVGVGI